MMRHFHFGSPLKLSLVLQLKTIMRWRYINENSYTGLYVDLIYRIQTIDDSLLACGLDVIPGLYVLFGWSQWLLKIICFSWLTLWGNSQFMSEGPFIVEMSKYQGSNSLFCVQSMINHCHQSKPLNLWVWNESPSIRCILAIALQIQRQHWSRVLLLCCSLSR